MRGNRSASIESIPGQVEPGGGVSRREGELTAADYEAVLADHRRLVRELDVLLNGEAGAAKQASLCDIVSQVRDERLCLSRAPHSGAAPEAELALVVEECPFDGFDRLARTPYLVMPKLAIQSMPMEWRLRLDALLSEAEAAGLETPDYYVFRGGDDEYTRARCVNEFTGYTRLVKGRKDPWANYRRGSVRALCSAYVGDHR